MGSVTKLPEPEATEPGWQDTLLSYLKDSPNAMIGNADIYVYKSKSDPMGFYYVFAFLANVVCTCKGFRFRDDCWHVKDYREKHLTD